MTDTELTETERRELGDAFRGGRMTNPDDGGFIVGMTNLAETNGGTNISHETKWTAFRSACAEIDTLRSELDEAVRDDTRKDNEAAKRYARIERELDEAKRATEVPLHILHAEEVISAGKVRELLSMTPGEQRQQWRDLHAETCADLTSRIARLEAQRNEAVARIDLGSRYGGLAETAPIRAILTREDW